MNEKALFREEAGRFVPSNLARGPWNPAFLHGGPGAALLTGVIEQAAPDPALQLARLTLDLFRPVPWAPLEVNATVGHAGRRVGVVEVTLSTDGADGTVVSRATGLLLRPSDAPPSDALDLGEPPPPLSAAGALSGPLGPADGQAVVAYHTAVEFRPIGEGPGLSATTSIRLPFALLPDEAMSPATRAAATADFVNPIGNMRRDGDPNAGFINADITLYLHRAPVGEWLCLALASRGNTDGIAVAAATLSDQTGPVGRCLAVSLANQRRPV